VTYKLVIFDFDGTLADSLPWLVSIANTVADRYKFKRIQEAELETLRGYTARQMIQHVGVPLWKVPMIANHVRKTMAEHIDQIRLFDGVDRLLPRLAAHGITLAMVSSNSVENIRQVLGPEHARLIHYYECGTSMFGKHTRFRKVLARSGFAPAEAICIGDEIRDLEAARRAGIAFGGVTWGYTTASALRALAPDELFSSVEELGDKLMGG
jgi:phosphoglycolate phosphatase